MAETKINISQEDTTTLGSGMSDHITIFTWDYVLAPQGTWVGYPASTTGYAIGLMYNSSNTDLDEVDYKASFSTGTYTFRIMHDKDTNRGIMELLIDNVSKGTKDCKAGSTTPNQLWDITGVAMTAGTHLIQLRVNGTTSAGYYITPSTISAWRTS